MKSFAASVLLLSCLARLGAHECWLQPLTFQPAIGAKVPLALLVGMNFQGDPRVFNPDRIAAFRLASTAGVADLVVREAASPHFDLPPMNAGTQMVAYDSKPSFIELDAEKFREYLVEEGLDHIIAERERAGEAGKPGRERYQRCIKSILQAGGKSDATYATVTGQRLELIPVNDPAALRPGGTLQLKVLLAGQPLAGAKLRAWHRQGDQLSTLDARSAASGEVAFTLPAAGEWMISIVHMARVTGDPAADWESYWGNLTFALTP